jgi:hypothetical protein
MKPQTERVARGSEPGMSSEAGTSRDPAARLSLKPDGSAAGFVDGAWWPGSRDFAAELPAVVADLAPRLGPVERVSYNLDAWPATPRKLRIDGAVVRMGGFHSLDADIVQMIGAQRRVTLLVIPPETEQQAALEALKAAGREGSTDDIESLLRAGTESEAADASEAQNIPQPLNGSRP